jgi:molecular chaperone GrpE
MSERSWVPDPPGSEPAAPDEEAGRQPDPGPLEQQLEGEELDGGPDEAAGEPEPAAEAAEGGAPAGQLAEVTAERDEYLDALRRLQADFENYRKRIIRQQTEHLERAAFDLVAKLLPVLDTIDLALAHAGGGAPDDGLTQVAAVANDALSREGLERLDPLGQPFDPVLHEAVAHEEAAEAGEKPVVSEVLRPGYRWKGQLLRPAMVKVSG